jgi:hypothetical protein
MSTNNAFNFICFDTEDNSKELMQSGQSGFDKQITQIAAMTAEGKKYYNKGDVAAFKQWVARQPEKYIYALNVQYDLGALFADELDKVDVVMVGGRTIRVNWGKKVFVDVFNIWPMSVKKLGEAFGIKKIETANMAEDKEYVFRDVEIIREAMLFAWQFCDSMGLDHLPATLGGLCVKLWKHWGGSNCHDSSAISKEGYYGGRVELFKTVNETPSVCWTDINSLYPFVMQQRFPDVLEDCGKKLMDYGMATVTISQPKDAIVTLPFRNSAGRILYPWGKFKGTWTIAELLYAESKGARIDKVWQVMGTNSYMIPYSTFVNKLYNMRLESKSEAERLFFKLLMNNLYGRLGTSGTIGRSVWQNDRNKFDGVPYGEKVLVNYNLPLSDETNWSHAAYVTSYGRIDLNRYMHLIGAESLIYTDTDSTIFDCPSKQPPFPIGSKLGEMKLEGWQTSVETFAPKMYRADNLYKAKGVPRHLAEAFIKKGHAEFDLPFKMREAIRFYDRGNKRKLAVWRQVQKFRREGYDRKKLIGNRFFPCKVLSTE